MTISTNDPPTSLLSTNIPTGFTQGSLIFAGASGVLAENNASLY